MARQFIPGLSSDSWPSNDEEKSESPADVRLVEVADLLRGHTLEDHAAMFLEVADRLGIDWRILPAIAIAESSGGDAACGYNFSGYASCAVNFESWADCADASARLLVKLGVQIDSDWAIRAWQSGPNGANNGGGYPYLAKIRALMLLEWDAE